MSEARQLVQTWDDAALDALETVRGLEPADFQRSTVLPGWQVHDVVAHLAHLEGVCAGFSQPLGGTVQEVSEEHPEPGINDIARAGVHARRDRTPSDLVEELESACAERRARLAQIDVDDPDAIAIGEFAALGWPLLGLLRNRPTDLWVHEQELRMATGLPLRLTGSGADHVAAVLQRAFPMALRRLPAGTTVVLRVTGQRDLTLAAQMGEDGRAKGVEPPASTGSSEPSATLEMSEETWLLLGSGRVDPEEAEVTMRGDDAVARRVLRQLNVMP